MKRGILRQLMALFERTRTFADAPSDWGTGSTVLAVDRGHGLAGFDEIVHAAVAELETRRAAVAAAEEAVAEALAMLHRALEGTIGVVARIVEMRDPYTAGHQQRVAELAGAIAVELGLPAKQIDGVRLAGQVHDLGKLSVPAEILNKAGGFNDTEWALVREHPRVGGEILHPVEFPWPIAEIVWQHHERFDGSGYPRGLRGEAILLEARIIAVADVVEAMSSRRPYRPALGLERALVEIAGHGGIRYDPEVAAACLRVCENAKWTHQQSLRRV